MKHQPSMLTNTLTDWVANEENVKLHIPLKTAEQLDTKIEQFTVDFQQAVWNNTPMLQPKILGLKHLREINGYRKNERQKEGASKQGHQKTKGC